jgi:multisubunit Na+/H+ antiporter MnhG subunit
MVLLLWIPGVVALLVGVSLVAWVRHTGMTWPFVLVTALLFVLMVLPIAAFYAVAWRHNWRLRPG